MRLEGSANKFLGLPGSPRFIYGTAWKKGRSAALVKDALQSGFRAVDTACQPKHYEEALVGQGLRDAFDAGICRREDILLQTKFTQPLGQDPRNAPYDLQAPLEDQIRQSVQVSLRNLRSRDDEDAVKTSYIDCLLLHSPIQPIQNTLLAWKVLEAFVPVSVRALGISNVTLDELQILHSKATVKPKVVQNRFYKHTRYDDQLRSFCRENNIVYESFWTLTANPSLISSAPVAQLAKAAGVDEAVALYALVMAQDVAVLNGTTNGNRMKGDLAGILAVQKWAISNESLWRNITAGFEALLH